MVTDMFGTLLQELGQSFGNIQLRPDQNNSCLIRLKEGISIQLELDRACQFLILGCTLGTLIPGKYRENIFHEALKANDMPYPLHGILGFSQKTGNLALFEKINVRDLNGEKIAAEIIPFVEKAIVWSEALIRNEIPAISQAYTSERGGGGMFGLKP